MKENESNFHYVLRLTLILLAITVVVAGLLGGVNAITQGPIAELKAEKVAKAIYDVLPTEESPEEISDFRDPSGLVRKYYKLGEQGYVVEVVVGGSQADIDMMVGVKADGSVSGISFVSMSETSGLGAVAAQDSSKGRAFREQFIGKSGSLAVTKDGGSIDSLTGATVTSRAVTNAVNAALGCSLN